MSSPSGGGAPGGNSGGGPGVGIVVVSHSRALATAAVALATEMLHGQQPRIAVAAGLDETTFGTDAVQIAAAIEQVDGERGVVVLMDLGSAVLSAEMALDLLDNPETRDRVLLCPAPLVEGLVVAAVVAAGGAPREEVAAEARAALLGKSAHLAAGDPAEPPAVEADAALVGSFVVANPHGLHARPAARLVAEVRHLDATVTLRNLTTGSPSVPAGSLSRVATLGALKGHEVEVSASGRQARAALDHVLSLAGRRFDEVDAAQEPAGPTTPAPAPPGSGAAVAASPAIRRRPLRLRGFPARRWRRPPRSASARSAGCGSPRSPSPTARPCPRPSNGGGW